MEPWVGAWACGVRTCGRMGAGVNVGIHVWLGVGVGVRRVWGKGRRVRACVHGNGRELVDERVCGRVGVWRRGNGRRCGVPCGRTHDSRALAWEHVRILTNCITFCPMLLLLCRSPAACTPSSWCMCRRRAPLQRMPESVAVPVAAEAAAAAAVAAPGAAVGGVAAEQGRTRSTQRPTCGCCSALTRR